MQITRSGCIVSFSMFEQNKNPNWNLFAQMILFQNQNRIGTGLRIGVVIFTERIMDLDCQNAN